MLPVRVGDQVARPTVRNFVDDYVREASVPGEERRRNKRQAGIFHPPVGERPWHAQDIVAPPFVGPAYFLRSVDHGLLCIELIRRLLDDALLRPHTRVGAGLLKPKISDGQRDYVGRTGDRLLEGERVPIVAIERNSSCRFPVPT